MKFNAINTMRSLVNHSPKLWLLITVMIDLSNAFPNMSGDKKLNLRIGFDLTQGENGAPSLRIRDFEDSSENSETKPRAADEEHDKAKTSPSIRAEYDSESSEVTNNVAARVESSSSKEQDRSDEAKSDDDDSDDSDRRLSTRGLVPEEYEPEENPRIHTKYEESSESDFDGPRYRGKRNISLKGLLENLKKKSREFFRSQRKHDVSVQR